MNGKTLKRDYAARYSLGTPASSLPELLTRCPKCGGEIELWSEEENTICIFCGHMLFERQTTH